MISVILS